MTWFLFAYPPLVFCVVLVVASFYAAYRGGGTNAEISVQVQRWFPALLALTLSFVGATLWVLIGQGLTELSWFGNSWQKGVLLGAFVGALIAGLYFTLLSPALVWLQRQFGDYVPPGSVLTTLEGQLPAFFIANVLLAPLVEEMWYRGALYTSLEPLGPVLSVFLTCLAFGLFHWPGGVWYMLLTGLVVGGAFMGLRLGQAGLLAPYAAHLTLNAIEFYVLARRHAQKTRLKEAL